MSSNYSVDEPMPLIIDRIVSDVSLVQSFGSFFPLEFWKMNLVSVSRRFLCVAVKGEVEIFQLNCNTGEVISGKVRKLRVSESSINSIRAFESKKNILVAVDMEGTISIMHLEIEDLVEAKIFKIPPLNSDIEDHSIWSISIYSSSDNPSQFKLLVGSNTHLVTEIIIEHDQKMRDLRVISTNSFSGHEHNVPSVFYSPNGLYFASCGIDSSLRVWKSISGAQIGQRNFEGNWGWSVRWIHKKFIKQYQEFRDEELKCAEEGPTQELDMYMLIFCTAKDLYVLDAKTLEIYLHEKDYLAESIDRLRQLDRIIHLEFAAQLSTILCASSGSNQISVSRLYWDTDDNLKLSKRILMPSSYQEIPLMGFAILPITDEYDDEVENSSYCSSDGFLRIYTVYASGIYSLFEINRDIREISSMESYELTSSAAEKHRHHNYDFFVSDQIFFEQLS
jgi:WD40 repeat protein